MHTCRALNKIYSIWCNLLSITSFHTTYINSSFSQIPTETIDFFTSSLSLARYRWRGITVTTVWRNKNVFREGISYENDEKAASKVCKIAVQIVTLPQKVRACGEGCQFHQKIYEHLFSHKSVFQSFYVLSVCVSKFFGKRKLVQKLLVKCWWNRPKVKIKGFQKIFLTSQWQSHFNGNFWQIRMINNIENILKRSTGSIHYFYIITFL